MSNHNDCNIIFAGTPEFSVPSLSALIDLGLRPSIVMTQPDRKAGRGNKLRESPVKIFAKNQGIPVWQPHSLIDSEFVAKLMKTNVDVIVVAAYGMIFPEEVLEIPNFGCINIHASLLPRWRGASPIQSTILHGDLETGVSLMRMQKELDNGPVYSQHKLQLTQLETADQLIKDLANIGAKVLKTDIDPILQGNIKPIVQDEIKATYTKKIIKRDALLDWSNSANHLSRQVRAYNSNPGAYFQFEEEMIKCWTAFSSQSDVLPGRVISACEKGIEIGCGKGSLVILELQRPGKNRITAGEFSRQIDIQGVQLS
ncbi:MAG TPA: methionyl-tRNA formyltransferase [Woeseiaceae bacterium]|jgi:methionyl-tRNA formyltransferase|nr:methionyl-tRNA formyltransferase [Woeseiaceae bacterium]|tara:strand:- start:25726 stop:26664 length:939 start_codon:yes stop_codon:yes gene_type:complete